MQADLQQLDSDYRFVYRPLAEALYDALAEDPFYITLEASVTARRNSRAAMLEYLDYSIRESDEYGATVIPAQRPYGVSVWLKPQPVERGKTQKSRKQAFLRRHLGDGSADAYREISAFMSARSEPLVETDAWYLSIVGILPRLRNRGLGEPLLTPVLESADAAGVSTYLETYTPRNHGFYERLGYRVAESFAEPTVGARYALMIRRPGAGADA